MAIMAKGAIIAMKTIAARDAKNHFGSLIDEARIEPVLVERNGRRAVIVLNPERYDELMAAQNALQEISANEILTRSHHLAPADDGLKSPEVPWDQIVKRIFSDDDSKSGGGEMIQFGMFRGQLGELSDADFKQAEFVDQESDD